MQYVTGSGKSGLKSPMIKQQKFAEMPFRWKIFNFRFLHVRCCTTWKMYLYNNISPVSQEI